MRCVDRCVASLVAAALALGLASCGGNSSVTTITGGDISGGTGGTTVTLDTPTGPNTTEVVVDSGPASGFSLGAANIPYVTVTVCEPGSATRCVTIDHVFLDTGSVGLRLLKSKVAGLNLPSVAVPADATSATPAGRALECYPFVLGAVWGPLASADLRIAGEVGADLPIQGHRRRNAAELCRHRPTASRRPTAACRTRSRRCRPTVFSASACSPTTAVDCITGNYSSGGYASTARRGAA